MVTGLPMLGIRLFGHKNRCVHAFHKARVGLSVVVSHTAARAAASAVAGMAIVVIPMVLVYSRLGIGIRGSRSIIHR